MPLSDSIRSTTPSGGVIGALPLRGFAITPSDNTVFEAPVAVHVGEAGDVIVEPFLGGGTLTYGMAAGSIVPVMVRRVLASTTATGLNGSTDAGLHSEPPAGRDLLPPDGVNGFGDPQFAAPMAVKVRWQDKAELFRDTQAREVVSSAIVYVSRDVEVGGRLGLGSLNDPETAREIRQKGASPDLRNDNVLVKAWL